MQSRKKHETKKEGKIITLALSDLPSRHVISLIFYAIFYAKPSQVSLSVNKVQKPTGKNLWQRTPWQSSSC